MKKKLLELFMKKFEQTNQKEFRIVKVIDKKGDQLYVKWQQSVATT